MRSVVSLNYVPGKVVAASGSSGNREWETIPFLDSWEKLSTYLSTK